ncbi:helix-turn-helix transcriptional regulator [Longimicrobium sp.]|uniref:helix-turn-helix domain-containing protein n=1 Tax=Longimicrobium sp. TaxID=2029185 RepID=UPI002E368188|nr:helix-turn-helix transcriptional regulator [Longimicrobium sp.]HEX6042314.1 helix-turn-helix transcriptional regulator [Longimicrobium sp.]
MKQSLLLVADPRAEAWAGRDFPAEPLRSPDDVLGAFDRTSGARSPVVWIADGAAQLCPLAQHKPRSTANHRLLLLNGASWEEREVLNLVFRLVVSPGQGMRLLPPTELKDVLAAPERGDLVIGGFASACDELVVLYRGTLEPLVVPFAWFQRRPGVRLDFEALGVSDYGQTVSFGDHEVSVDNILYEHDPAYRKRARQRELQSDESFGASVRRLRLSRGLRRGDFEGISEKEIARIERGEITAPHRRTLEAIAARLGVEVGELGAY